MNLIFDNLYLEIIFKALVVIAISFALNFVFRIYFSFSNKKAKKIKAVGERRLRRTRIDFFKKMTNVFIFIVAVVYILFLIPGFSDLSISLLAGAGIAAVIIGFAAQKTLANLVSGISIVFFSPFRIGDRLKIGDEFGDVEELNLRHTVVRTWDNRRIIIPNSIISEKEIINYSLKDERTLRTINIGISYDSNIDKAKKIMIDLAKKHLDVIVPEIKSEDDKIDKKEPNVRVTKCGDFSVNLRLYFWVSTPGKAWSAEYDLIEQIKKEFDKKGIEIPFPYRTIVYKKDLEKKK